MGFTWFPEQTAIIYLIYLYSISLFVFIAEMRRVYCSVRNEPLTTTAARLVLVLKRLRYFLISKLLLHAAHAAPAT